MSIDIATNFPGPPEDPERALRRLWTSKGVPVERQDALIADIAAKAAPGAMFGPFVISGTPPAFELSPTTPPEAKPINPRPAPRPRWGQAALDLD